MNVGNLASYLCDFDSFWNIIRYSWTKQQLTVAACSHFTCINHAQIRSWNQPVLSNEGKYSCSMKQREPLLGLKLTADRYPLTHDYDFDYYPLCHAPLSHVLKLDTKSTPRIFNGITLTVLILHSIICVQDLLTLRNSFAIRFTVESNYLFF